jgi:hypothetical protein
MGKLITALTVVAAVLVSPAFADTCLDTRDIVNARSDDGKIMKFQMRNGETYINHLRGSCPDLKFNGFVWTVRGLDRVCANVQSLRVLNSGQICGLGDFDGPTTRAPG